MCVGAGNSLGVNTVSPLLWQLPWVCHPGYVNDARSSSSPLPSSSIFTFIEILLCVRHLAEHFICIILFSPHTVLWHRSYTDGEKGGSEKLNTLPEVIGLGKCGAAWATQRTTTPEYHPVRKVVVDTIHSLGAFDHLN